jgi:hypothetical protein
VAGSSESRAACPSGAATSFYDDARKAFVEKRFDDSVALLRQAYQCDPRPVYLANVARSYEEANRPKDALGAWRSYLAVVTNPGERTTVEGRISALAKVVDDLERLEREKDAAEDARRKAEAKASERPPAPPAPDSRHVPAGAWIVSTAGGVGMLGGAVLWIIASSKHSSANQQVAQELQEHQPTTAAEATNHDAQSLGQAGNVTFVAASVVAAVGVGWAGLSLIGPGRSEQTAELRFTGTGFDVTGHF